MYKADLGNNEELITYLDGTKHYFKNDQLHRDGYKPAITCYNEIKHYYKNGVKYDG